MNLKRISLFFGLFFLTLPLLVALPTTPHTAETTAVSVEKMVQKKEKKKKGLFKRLGQNFVAKRIKKMMNKHLGTQFAVDGLAPTWRQDVANADDNDLKDAKLIGLLLGLLLGLIGTLGIAIFWKKGPRKKAAINGSLIGVLIIVGIVLIASVL